MDLDQAPLEPTDAERQLVARFADKLTRAKDKPAVNVTAEQAKKYRSRLAGHMDNGSRVRANLIGSTYSSLVPHVYAQNPQLRISPSDSIGNERMSTIDDFAKTCEIVMNNEFREADFKAKAKAAVRSALAVKVGWLKVGFQETLGEDPGFRERGNDSQDNIQRMQALVDRIEGGESYHTVEADTAELEATVEGVEAQTEVSVRRGMVYDFVQPEMLRMDPTVRSYHGYRYAEWIADARELSCEQFEAEFGRKPEAGKATEKALTPGAPAEEQMFWIWEIWHRPSAMVYTWCEGETRWARVPFPAQVGEHWFPYFPICFNPVDGQFLGSCLPDELYELQVEYDELSRDRTQGMKNAKPFLMTSGQTDSKDIVKRQMVGAAEILVLENAQNLPITEVFKQNVTNFNPASFDTTWTRSDIELTSGLGDAERGNIGRAKTLGEAEILQSGLATRTGEHRDAVEDWFLAIVEYSLQILLARYSPQDVQRVAGAGAVWPQMEIEDRFRMLSLQVKVGSSGKPDKQKEQEAWSRLLLPQLKEFMETYLQWTQMGLDTAPLLELVAETLRRFDEKLDVQKFLPKPAAMMPGMGLTPDGGMNGPVAAGAGIPGQPAGPPGIPGIPGAAAPVQPGGFGGPQLPA